MRVQFAHQIQAEHLVWTDFEELANILNTLAPDGWPYMSIRREEVTGALVNLSDGEYSEAWLTCSSRPYCVNAPYQKAFPREA